MADVVDGKGQSRSEEQNLAGGENTQTTSQEKQTEDQLKTCIPDRESSFAETTAKTIDNL